MGGIVSGQPSLALALPFHHDLIVNTDVDTQLRTHRSCKGQGHWEGRERERERVLGKKMICSFSERSDVLGEDTKV